MLRLVKFITACWLVALVARNSEAFSLLGPYESWQTEALGYDIFAGDIGGPMNLGEEYRWNTPILTYGFDESFLNYFGTNGVKAIDAAVNLFNRIPAVSEMSSDLSEFSTDTKRVNFRASALGLLDMKSYTMHLLLEQTGLAEAERYVWTLRDREVVGDPAVTNYLVIQRNFDPVTFQPSRYVNDIQYTYTVREFEDPDFADAMEEPLDPTAIGFTSVSGGFLSAGQFYTGYTRDDAGGYRYLYNTNNYNREAALAGVESVFVDRTTVLLSTNLDLALLTRLSRTSPPPFLRTNFPGLVIANTNITLELRREMDSVISTNIGEVFTNRQNLLVLTNQDLALLTEQSRTSPPPVLQALYPGLEIASTNRGLRTIVEPGSIILTNEPPEPWAPAGTLGPFVIITNFVTNIIETFNYTYANVLTNYSSDVSRRVIRNIEVLPQGFSVPGFPIFKTNVGEVATFPPLRSGGFLVQDTNVVGYEFTGIQFTNIIAKTNVVLDFFDPVTGAQFRQEEVTFFTNVVYGVYPIEFRETLVTNFVTNVVPVFEYEFANVLTNLVSTNSDAVLVTLEITQGPIQPNTNIITSNAVPGFVTGSFEILGTNVADFEPTGFQLTNIVPVTNVIFDVTNPTTGIRLRQELRYVFTNIIRAVHPVIAEPAGIALRPGVDDLQFIRVNYDSVLNTNLISVTNQYQAVVLTNDTRFFQEHRRIVTEPDFLFLAQDLGTVDEGVGPFLVARRDTDSWINGDALNGQSELAGPGVIPPQVQITFSKLIPSYFNSLPGFPSEEDAFRFSVWASFDGTTNPPIIFPQDLTLQNLEEQVLRENQGE